MHLSRFRALVFGTIFVIALTSGLVARPLVKGWAVDGNGQARISLSQRQIFDEVGGKATLGIDVPAGLAVFSSDLGLPEEAGELSGKAYVGLASQSVSAVTDFTYAALGSKKLQLDMDYRAVEDTRNHSGSNHITLDYPLSLEHVPPKVARYLARTSYDVVGHATWSHYTDATGTLKVKIQDPDLKQHRSEVEELRIRVVNSGAQVALHIRAVANSMTARLLQDRRAVEFGIPMAMKFLGITCQARLAQAQLKGQALEADLQLHFYDLRKTVARWQASAMKNFRHKGVDRRDVSVALSTLCDFQVPSADIIIRTKGDHFEVEASLTATGLNNCVLGYLRLKEILEPALVRERAHSEPLSLLVKNIEAVRAHRFRNVVASVAGSKDAGDCDYTFKLGFPRGRMALNAEFKYQGNHEAYAFASEKMKIPVVRQAYSLLKVKTTPGGLKGHALYEAQGAWLESSWALCAEATRQAKELQALFPASGTPALEEGGLLVDLKKSRVIGAGWIQAKELAPYVRAVTTATAGAEQPDPVALDVRYDADKVPGKILADLYVKGSSREAVVQALQNGLGKGSKPATSSSLAPPTLARPKMEIPKELATEIEADRKTLGVTPWTPSAEPSMAEKVRPSLLKGFLLVSASLLALAAIPLLRRRLLNAQAGVLVLPATHTFTRTPALLEPGARLSGMCLRIVGGSAAGQVVSLPEHDLELGRGEPTGLRTRRLDISEPTISRSQARLEFDGVTRRFRLQHEPAATNPTLIGETPVSQHVLKPGDTIQVGRLVMRFEAEVT